MSNPTLVLGTHNKKKGAELAELLSSHRIPVLTLADFDDSIEVVEDGDSFEANARKKATQQAQHLGQWVLGEDSGLCVDALDGAPGIYSARYSGEGATDQSNNEQLLQQLCDVPTDRRGAYYVCHATLADPTGQVKLEDEAICRGRIRVEPAGVGGFGYDPLFELLEYHRTFGEMGGAAKSVLSHRARVMRRLIPRIVAQFKLCWAS